MMVRRKKEEEEEQLPDEDGRCKRRRMREEEEEEEDGVKFVKPEEMEQDGRRREKTGSPPMRYLRKPEDQSHGPSAANQSKTCGAMMEEERRGGVGLTEGTDSSTVETSGDRRVSERWKHCQVCLHLVFSEIFKIKLHRKCLHSTEQLRMNHEGV